MGKKGALPQKATRLPEAGQLVRSPRKAPAKMPPVEEIEAAAREGITFSDMGARFGATAMAAKNWCDRLGIKKAPAPRPDIPRIQANEKNRPWTEVQDEWLLQLLGDKRVMVKGQPSLKLIAEQMNRTPEGIRERIDVLLKATG